MPTVTLASTSFLTCCNFYGLFFHLSCLFCKLPQIISGTKQLDERMERKTQNEVVEAKGKVGKRGKDVSNEQAALGRIIS